MNTDDTGNNAKTLQTAEEPPHGNTKVLIPDSPSDVEERALTQAEARQKGGVTGRMSIFSEVAPKLDAVTPFARAPMRVIRNEGDTEHLLNGLIAECHLLMRSVALPTAMRSVDADTRNQFLGTAINLAKVGAKVGGAVAKLRGAGTVNEIRQRHVTEHVLTTPAPLSEKELRT